MRRVNPEVYLIASPSIDANEMGRYLATVGVPEWLDEHDEAHASVNDAETLIEFMGRLCYRSFEPGLNANVTKIRTDQQEYLQNIIKVGHGSVLEHANFTFVFANVSRVFTHELVRHRVGVAYSQESLRFVRLTDLGLWLPPGTPANIVEIFERAFRDAEEMQLALAKVLDLDNLDMKFDQKKVLTSLMRRVAPDGLATAIGMTANIRTLRHLIEMRTSVHAEAEIRIVFDSVAQIMKDVCPMLFADYMRDAKSGVWSTPNRKV